MGRRYQCRMVSDLLRDRRRSGRNRERIGISRLLKEGALRDPDFSALAFWLFQLFLVRCFCGCGADSAYEAHFSLPHAVCGDSFLRFRIRTRSYAAAARVKIHPTLNNPRCRSLRNSHVLQPSEAFFDSFPQITEHPTLFMIGATHTFLLTWTSIFPHPVREPL